MTIKELAKQYEEAVKTAKTEEKKQLNKEIVEYLSHYYDNEKVDYNDKNY